MDLNAKPQRLQDAEQDNDGSQGEDGLGMTGKGYWAAELNLEMPFFIPLANIPLTTPWVLRKWLISMIIWDTSECFLGHASPGRSRPVQVSQTNAEIPDEDLNASKTPKLTGRRCLKIGVDRSQSGLIGVNRSIEYCVRMAKSHDDKHLEKIVPNACIASRH
jgi:hypothetical protein